MNKKFMLAIIILIIFILFSAFFLRFNLKRLCYNEVENKIVYETESFDKFENKDMSIYFISDIDNLDSLISNSKYFIKGRVDSKYIYGNGIINKITILNSYKGNLEKTIDVYDLATVDSYLNAYYYASTTPLLEGKEYYLFLNDSIRPNKKNTYVFSNYKYGYFSLEHGVKVLKEYENYSLTLDKIKEYDFVNIKDEFNYKVVVTDNKEGEYVYYKNNDYTLYKSIKEQILNSY